MQARNFSIRWVIIVHFRLQAIFDNFSVDIHLKIVSKLACVLHCMSNWCLKLLLDDQET